MKIKNNGQTPEGIYDTTGALHYVFPGGEIDIEIDTETRAFQKLLRNRSLSVEGHESSAPERMTLGELNSMAGSSMSEEEVERSADLARDIANLEDQLASAQSDLEILRGQVTTLTAEKEQLLGLVDDTNAKLTAATIENEALKSQLEASSNSGSSEPEFVPGHLKEVTAGLEVSGHKGSGHYSIQVGETEVVTKLVKAQTDEFKKLTTDRERTDWVNKIVAG